MIFIMVLHTYIHKYAFSLCKNYYKGLYATFRAKGREVFLNPKQKNKQLRITDSFSY